MSQLEEKSFRDGAIGAIRDIEKIRNIKILHKIQPDSIPIKNLKVILFQLNISLFGDEELKQLFNFK